MEETEQMTPDHLRSVLHISIARNSQKIVFLSLMTTLAMVLQILEHLLPNPFPWIRLGIANVILLIVLALFGIKEGLMVTGLRVVMASILLGTIFGPTFWLSLGGGIVSTLVMGILMDFFPKTFSIIGRAPISIT
jgi:heptaprenyl diphosphate synthase